MNKNRNKLNGTLLNVFVIFCCIGLVGAATIPTSNTEPTSMVVDFTSTSLDSKLSRGDSGILNLVIKNTGGMPAEKVEIWLPGTASIHIDKRQYIGYMEAGSSKTIQAIIRIDDNAQTGLNVIQARINYDGFESDGDRKNLQTAVWEIPVRIYSNPSFQLRPSKTTYYKDTTEDLILEGTVKEKVKDIEAKISSNCLTVIGSSQAYIGDVRESKDFNITYNIKPTTAGACTSSVKLTYTDPSGGKSTEDVSFGLNIQEAGVDFKITNVSYKPTGPGETVELAINLKNIGEADAQGTTLSLGAGDPFAPVDTLERYIETVGSGEEAIAKYRLSVSWDAVTQTYTIPLTITYKVGGTTYTSKKDIGIDVSGKVILSIINVDSSTGTVRIDIANMGTRTANAVKATLIVGGSDVGAGQQGFGGRLTGNFNYSETTGGGRVARDNTGGGPAGGNFSRTDNATAIQTYVSYKSDIKSGKQTTFTFSASGTGPATLLIEYSGENNQRITQRETITLQGRSSLTTGRNGQTTIRGTGGINYIEIGLYAIVAIVILFIAYRLYKRRKK